MKRHQLRGKHSHLRLFLALCLVLSCILAAPVGCARETAPTNSPDENPPVHLSSLPAYEGAPFIELEGNIPAFSDSDLSRASFEDYAPLDELGRCGTAMALVGPETMPTEKRGSIGDVKPSGWQLVSYDIVEGRYLYNRCHLLGYQLTGENANPLNLITGTRYLNTEGMLPFENAVADYVDKTANHVLFRVTPVFQGEELVARGVHMEARSIEDDGVGVCFNVFAYNVQPGIEIDYATGESRLANHELTPPPSTESTPNIKPNPDPDPDPNPEAPQSSYVLNTNSKKFHEPTCSSVDDMNEQNKEAFAGTREEVIAKGYEPCGRCKP